jgi:hypothetical protein
VAGNSDYMVTFHFYDTIVVFLGVKITTKEIVIERRDPEMTYRLISNVMSSLHLSLLFSASLSLEYCELDAEQRKYMDKEGNRW